VALKGFPPGRAQVHATYHTAHSGARRSATPIYVSERARTLLVAATGVALGVLCWRAPAAIAALCGGAFLAVLLSVPVAGAARVLPRGLAVLAVLLAGAGALVLVLVAVLPRVIVQLAGVGRALPHAGAPAEGFLQRTVLAPLGDLGLLPAGTDDTLRQVAQGLLRDAAAAAQAVLSGVQASLSGLASAGFLVLSMVAMATYFLLDARRIEAGYLRPSPTATGTTPASSGAPRGAPSPASRSPPSPARRRRASPPGSGSP
jgi:predicted PurR-regulated permease PerM